MVRTLMFCWGVFFWINSITLWRWYSAPPQFGRDEAPEHPPTPPLSLSLSILLSLSSRSLPVTQAAFNDS